MRDDNRRLRDDRRNYEKDIEKLRSTVKSEKEALEKDKKEMKRIAAIIGVAPILPGHHLDRRGHKGVWGECSASGGNC